MEDKIVNKPCGNCNKIVSVLCSKDSEIIGVKCPNCEMFDLLKNQAKFKHGRKVISARKVTPSEYLKECLAD